MRQFVDCLAICLPERVVPVDSRRIGEKEKLGTESEKGGTGTEKE
jgi:hypothetical protein